MNRIKLNLPETFVFKTTLTIRITDLNYGGHAGNDTFLSLVHEARQQFFISHGYREMDIAGVGLMIADSAVEYKKELNYGDSVTIWVAATNFDRLGFDLFYKLEIIEEDSTVLAGKAKTGILCYDYTNKKLVAVPEIVKLKLIADKL